MNTKKNLIRLMLAGIFILTVCFYFSIDYYHQGLPLESVLTRGLSPCAY